MMGGGAAKVEESMLHLRCRECQAFSRVGLNANDATFSGERQQLLGRRGFPERFVRLRLRWLPRYFFPYLFSWEKNFSRILLEMGKMHNAMRNKALASYILATGLLRFYLDADWNPRRGIEALMRCWQISLCSAGNVIFLSNILSRWISAAVAFCIWIREVRASWRPTWCCLHSLWGGNWSPKVLEVQSWVVMCN